MTTLVKLPKFYERRGKIHVKLKNKHINLKTADYRKAEERRLRAVARAAGRARV